MLRFIPMTSAEGAKDYHRRALSRGEYYTEERITAQEIVGRWGGEVARRLKLGKTVSVEAFERLCDNLHPGTGERLTQRMKDGRRVGYDINFHVPKSVSAILELGGDTRVLDAFRDAVHETMREMEREMKTRVRKGGADATRVTGNMVWADYVHFTARPVDGTPDFHLHCHAVAFNATWDPIEKQWKAGEFGDLKRDAPYFQAAYHARLAERLVRLGYGIERTSDGWEIAGVPRSVIEKFSRRTEQIEAVARKENITDPTRKAEIGARTRSGKLDLLSMDHLRTVWASRLTPQEAAAIRDTRINANPERSRSLDVPGDLSAALAFAKSHVFEKQSVISLKRFLAAALEQGVGRVTPEAIREETEGGIRDGSVLRRMVEDQAIVTTPEVIAEEHAMLAWARDGRGQHDPLKATHQILDADLSAEQRAAVFHVLRSTDVVVAIRGRAGVGKTRTMREVVHAIESTGKTVQVAAPTAMATHEVLRSDGFGNARTVASLLKDPKSAEKLAGQVLWVDEAGLVSVPDMVKLATLARAAGARIVLTGDTAQHRSVIRGDALRLLETRSGIRPVELTEVRRQQVKEYRTAVEHLARGDLDAGYMQLDQMGAIREVADQDRAAEVARSYKVSVNIGRSTLVVSPTHIEGDRVTTAIRAALREAGRLADDGRVVNALVNRHLSEAERADPARYRPGDVVQFEQHAGGRLKKGSQAMVEAVENGRVKVRPAGGGPAAELPLSRVGRFQVYEPRQLELAAGDRVRITHGGKTADGRHRLHNGAIYDLAGFTKSGRLKLGNGWEVDPGFGHVTHGFCVTSDAAQGRNVDHVIVAQSAESAAASSIQQFYTSVTRGKLRVTVFTDDKERLMKSVARDTSRVSAVELVGLTPPREHAPRRSLGLWLNRQRTKLVRAISLDRSREQQRDITRTRSESRGFDGPERTRER